MYEVLLHVIQILQKWVDVLNVNNAKLEAEDQGSPLHTDLNKFIERLIRTQRVVLKLLPMKLSTLITK